MRREEQLRDPSDQANELEAIEAQWTSLWESEGRPGRPERIQRRVELRIMHPYIKTMPKGSRFLDGGCGMGDWVVRFTRAGYPTLGLDVSKLTIGKLKEMFPEMEFAVGDIRDTGLPTSCMDLYFSWGTFEHFEEGFDRVVQEAFRILKPGGPLFISVPFENLRHALHSTLSATWRRQAQPASTRFYQWCLTRNELAAILTRHGFAVEDVKIIHKREGVRRWLHESFGMRIFGTATRGLAFCLAPFLPGVLIGHMIMAIARKPPI